MATADIRITGSSEGALVEREYTLQELDDCEHVIQQLADHPHSNGRVGMYGLSWSVFNSLMMATLRRPPALKAIFAAHGTDDLYSNDIHYADGIYIWTNIYFSLIIKMHYQPPLTMKRINSGSRKDLQEGRGLMSV